MVLYLTCERGFEMNKKDLYNEFLINQEIIEEVHGKKLEETKVHLNGVMEYDLNTDVLDTVIDVLAKNGNFSDDDVTKNIYKNSYLLARRVAYQDFCHGSRGYNRDAIMKEIFEDAKSCIYNTRISARNFSDSIKYEFAGCSNCRKYQEELIDYFGLNDGELKSSVDIARKYGSVNPNVAFDWFCNLFLDKINKLNRSKKRQKQLLV